jgi:peptide/nickel transport system permease protein
MASISALQDRPSANALAAPRQQTWLGRALRRFARQRVSLAAAIVLCVIALSAAFAPVIAQHDPTEQFRRDGKDANGLPVGPSAKFWLGTDGLQRDMFSRLVWGARSTLLVGVVASLCAVLVGVAWGSAAALRGGSTENAMMRVVDVLMSLPTFFVILLFIVVLQQRSLALTIFVIIFASWTFPARVFRAEVLSLKERDYITAARSLGASSLSIFARHLLPQLLPLIVIYTSLGVPAAIFTEAGLSYLGLGVPPPNPVWGGMIQEGRTFYRASPMLVILPGLAIMVTVICFNLLSTGLRDALDPTVT